MVKWCEYLDFYACTCMLRRKNIDNCYALFIALFVTLRHRCYLYSMVVFHVHNATLSEMSRWGISDGIFDFVGYLVEIK